MIGRIVAAGALFLFLAVAAGAFGAHALRDRLDEYSRGVFDKAVFYHFIHGLGLLMVGALSALKVFDEGQAFRLALMFGAGIVIFSGSLYVLAISGVRWLGAITPFGGTLFLIAWGYMAYSAWTYR